MQAEWFPCPVGQADAVAARVRALVPDGTSVSAAVAEIVQAVRVGGDTALRDAEARFGVLAEGAALRVSDTDLVAALDGLDPQVRAGLEVARENVARVSAAGRGSEPELELPQGHAVRVREVPVRRAAIYAPGGRTPYPSSVVMGVICARAAGVDEVVVAANEHPVMLAAAALCGADEVYRIGGAQAIAALAHGTESIAPVDVIVGAGNLYVQEAKRQLSGKVGIDGFAGPSDLVVLASEGANPGWAALDLLAQAEHGPDSLVVAVSPDEAWLDDLAVELGARLRDRPTVSAARCALVHAGDLETALKFSERLAPEHLELAGADAEALAPRVRSAGCLFVGSHGATAFGDYVAGSNHTLPTEGAARFASGLSVRAFTRRMNEVRITPEAATALAPHGAAIARAEGYAVHAESMEARAAMRQTEPS